jgi:hypothetical protein
MPQQLVFQVASLQQPDKNIETALVKLKPIGSSSGTTCYTGTVTRIGVLNPPVNHHDNYLNASKIVVASEMHKVASGCPVSGISHRTHVARVWGNFLCRKSLVALKELRTNEVADNQRSCFEKGFLVLRRIFMDTHSPNSWKTIPDIQRQKLRVRTRTVVVASTWDNLPGKSLAALT